MQFTDYQAFRVALQWLIEGDELSDTFSVNTLDLIVGLGEGRVYHGDRQTAGLRASSMLKPLAQVVTSNVATLPADLLELKELRFAGQAPLELIPLDRLRTMVENGGGGTTAFAAQDGDTLVFYPEASGTLIGSYYARPTSVVTVSPWSDATTFARYPELFTYACLYEAALFLGMDSKMGLWEGRYRQLADGANHSERMRAYGGSPLRTRSR